MKEHPTCSSNQAPDPAARCGECGAFGATQFGDLFLCTDCYAGKGSCCPEFGKDDLWETHGDEQTGKRVGSALEQDRRANRRSAGRSLEKPGAYDHGP